MKKSDISRRESEKLQLAYTEGGNYPVYPTTGGSGGPEDKRLLTGIELTTSKWRMLGALLLHICVVLVHFSLSEYLFHNIYFFVQVSSDSDTTTTLGMTSQISQDPSLESEECPSDTTFTPPSDLGIMRTTPPETRSISVSTQHKPEETEDDTRF